MAAQIDTVALSADWHGCDSFKALLHSQNIAYTQRVRFRFLAVILQTTRRGTGPDYLFFSVCGRIGPEKLSGHKVTTEPASQQTDVNLCVFRVLTAVRVFGHGQNCKEQTANWQRPSH